MFRSITLKWSNDWQSEKICLMHCAQARRTVKAVTACVLLREAKRKKRKVQFSPPCPQFLNILWKWNDLVSMRPNDFIFIGCLRKNEIESAKRTPAPIHMNPLSRNPGSFIGIICFFIPPPCFCPQTIVCCLRLLQLLSALNRLFFPWKHFCKQYEPWEQSDLGPYCLKFGLPDESVDLVGK